MPPGNYKFTLGNNGNTVMVLLALAVLSALVASGCATGTDSVQVSSEANQSADAALRKLNFPSESVGWVLGRELLRTEDGGSNWRNISPPGVSGQDLLDLESLSGRELTAVTSPESGTIELHQTANGGRDWKSVSQVSVS